MTAFLINDREQRLVMAIQSGFPLTPRPFQTIGHAIGLTESEVIAGLSKLRQRGIIKRMGLIVRHRELGFHANAMVVWDLPNDLVRVMGKRVSEFDFVTLCYQRRRCVPRWPYNLYCMIHGRERKEVLHLLDDLEACCGLEEVDRQVLFSQRRFKQRGAHYFNHRSASELRVDGP